MGNWYMVGDLHSESVQFEATIVVFYVCKACNCPTSCLIGIQGWGWNDEEKGKQSTEILGCQSCQSETSITVTIGDQLKFNNESDIEMNTDEDYNRAYYESNEILFFKFLWSETEEGYTNIMNQPDIDDMDDHQFFSH